MLKIQKTWFLLSLIVIGCSASETNEKFDLSNFERIKHSFFNINQSELIFESLSSNDWECLAQLGTIGKSLLKGDLWALKREFSSNFLNV